MKKSLLTVACLASLVAFNVYTADSSTTDTKKTDVKKPAVALFVPRNFGTFSEE